ncbi:MAG TPA: 2-oxoacid:acceptor oxidoreductase subunit alpha [bacterium]|nr:2-oxoacid:acceptor oxidoreductase subunit alpha [bacterium]
MANDIVIAFGGAAGDGNASAGNILAQASARQGLHVYAYNSYQSLIRGGHSYLRIRISDKKVTNHGDQVTALVTLNQDSMNRHLSELVSGGFCIYNSDKLKAGTAPAGVQMCPFPFYEIAGNDALPVMQNTVAIGILTRMIGMDFDVLKSVFEHTFAKKPQVVEANVKAAKAGYDYAEKNFKPLANALGKTKEKLAFVTGNELLAMGAANAGCKVYCAYPMSPASGILHWMGAHGKDLGICVRQVEDEIGVINMTIGAAHMGTRAMCATSGGGFALMTEAIGMASIMETPIVAINVMRGGPSTGLPTKQEQGDLNQAIGASPGDFPRMILAPTSIPDCYRTVAESFNWAEKYQIPVILLSDLLMSEGTETVGVDWLDYEPKIDRGEMIFEYKGGPTNYYRYKDTPSGVSPRAIPGTPEHLYVSATDEHDEDGVTISDVYTDPIIRKKMVDKRARKMDALLKELPPPQIEGPADAPVTLITYGSTWGVVKEAVETLNKEGVKVNHLSIKYLVPFQEKEVTALLKGKKTVVVEMNKSGQFARHLRAEAGITVDANIRKYDGEPFEPKHVVAAVKEVLKGKTLVESQSVEPGWRTPHPPGPGVLSTSSTH